jgi:hypothetical protein
MFRVIFAGGRDFANYELMCTELDYLLANKVAAHEEIVIISGTANGADKYGERYARERGYRIDQHPADWDRYGKSAGYKRNAEMASVADACVCFWDGQSKGTRHMINIAEEQQLPTRIIHYIK